MKAIFRLISLLAILLPYFLGAQNNLAVNFSDGFIGTRGNNSQDADNILNFSTLGISYAQFYQSDSDGDGLFSVQGNDIPGRIKIVLDDGTVIDYAASVTWRDSNNNYVFGVLFSSSDDPAINFNSIVYNTGTLQLYSGNINNVSSNLGLIVSGTGFSIADGSSINGNAATKTLLNALNSYYSSSVSSDSTNPTISDQTFSYNENTSSVTEIGNVLANDNVGVSSYNISAGNVDGYFAIDNSGSISLTTTGASSAANDFEVLPNSHLITVQVSDANGNASSATITLNELDVAAESGFTITSSMDPLVVAESGTTATFTVVLNSEPSSNVVLSVTSSDKGEATVSPSTLTFTSANWNTTQTVTVTGVDDTLVDGTIGSTMTVSVVDASSDDDFDGLSDQTVSVSTTDDDAGDNIPPVITDATGDLALGTGDSYVGDTVGVSATDNVDGDVTADIVVTGDTVDTDVPGTYTITYNVTDSAGNAATAVTRTVTVTDDDAPVITKEQSFSYTENQEAGYVVGNILATDNIKVDKLILKSVFGFNESDYTSNEWFALDASSGILSLTAAGSAGSANDYETTPNSYSLTIEATDTNGNSSTETVLVAITDVDDTAPVLDGLFDEVNESGVYIYRDLTLEGTIDTYEFVSNEDATWSLTGDDAVSFVLVDETEEVVMINYATNNYNTPTNAISSKRVKLRFKVAPDYENPIDINFDNIYDLFVNVTDAYNNTSQIETEITVIPDADGDGVTDEEDPDDDNDGVEDIYDLCPGTQPGTPVDVNGCDLLIIASEEFRVSAKSATCSNTSDGEIQVTALNQNHNYEVSVTGRSGVIGLNTNEGYTASITGLSKGSYQVCFTVVGDDIFEQCFTVYIDQPEALQVVSTYLESKQALDLEIAGATEYYVELNGVLQSRRGTKISLALQKGMNRVRIYTNIECQGVIEEEIFVSEKLEYAPNPVEEDLNLYVGGVDSTLKLTITDLNGILIESREVRVPTSRVYSMNMTRYPEGIYILTAEGGTISKSIKIIKR